MEQEKTIPVEITCYSQEHVLRYRMQEQNLRHGDRVKADISEVRLERHNFADGSARIIMYFCPMGGIHIREVFGHGDKARLPESAILDGLKVPENTQPGLYNLKNIELFSNVTMQVIATADTVFEAV